MAKRVIRYNVYVHVNMLTYVDTTYTMLILHYAHTYYTRALYYVPADLHTQLLCLEIHTYSTLSVYKIIYIYI